MRLKQSAKALKFSDFPFTFSICPCIIVIGKQKKGSVKKEYERI